MASKVSLLGVLATKQGIGILENHKISKILLTYKALFYDQNTEQTYF